MSIITTAMNKEALYDAIGKCNIAIVDYEHRIPELEELLTGMVNEPDNEMAVRQSLHEYRIALDKAKTEAKQHRLTLIGRLELELEQVEREIKNAHPNWNEGEAMRHMITRELETLRKLV